MVYLSYLEQLQESAERGIFMRFFEGYDPEKVRELIIETIGDQFVDMYIMDVPNLNIFKLFIKTKEEVNWDDVDSKQDKVSPYFRALNGYDVGVQIYTTLGLKGAYIYVKDGLHFD